MGGIALEEAFPFFHTQGGMPLLCNATHLHRSVLQRERKPSSLLVPLLKPSLKVVCTI